MKQREFSRTIARAIVGLAAGALVAKLFGRKAGIVGAATVLLAHELLDAPVAEAIEDLMRAKQ
jgi:hypothetical protein